MTARALPLSPEMRRVLRLMHRAEDATVADGVAGINYRGGHTPVSVRTLRALEARGLLSADVCPGVTFYTITEAGVAVVNP